MSVDAVCNMTPKETNDLQLKVNNLNIGIKFYYFRLRHSFFRVNNLD